MQRLFSFSFTRVDFQNDQSIKNATRTPTKKESASGGAKHSLKKKKLTQKKIPQEK